MSSNFQISLGAAASGGGGAWPVNNVPITIAHNLAELIAQNADVFQCTGANVINLDAGTNSKAYSGQVGRVIGGTTVTTEMVQANKEFLRDFGQYCRDFGIAIDVLPCPRTSPSAVLCWFDVMFRQRPTLATVHGGVQSSSTERSEGKPTSAQPIVQPTLTRVNRGHSRTTAARQITAEQLLHLGKREMAYLKSDVRKGELTFVLYGADGTPLVRFDTVETAVEAGVEQGIDLVAVN